MSLLLRLQSICTNSIGFTKYHLSPKHPSVDNEVKGRHMRQLTALLFCRPGASIFKSYKFGKSNLGEDTPSTTVYLPSSRLHVPLFTFLRFSPFFLLPLPSLHDHLPPYTFTLDCSNVYILPSRHLIDHILTSCFPAFQL